MAKAARGTGTPPPVVLQETGSLDQPRLEGCKVGAGVRDRVALLRVPRTSMFRLGSELLHCSLSVECVWRDLDYDFQFIVSFPESLVVQWLENHQDLTGTGLPHPSSE